MRKLLAFALLTGALLAQTGRKPFFPVPKDIHDLSAATGRVTLPAEAQSALAAEFPALQKASSCSAPPTQQEAAALPVDLKSHPGFVVRIDDRCICGDSGNCPILVLLKDGNNYKVVLADGSGWGFALEEHGADMPSLIIASHASPKVSDLQRYLWKGGRYKLKDCQAWTPRKKDPSVWSEDIEDIAPCDQIPAR